MTDSSPHSWLALGDSYTIGEALPLYENYPYQCLQMLRRSRHAFHAPEIIARTGWTTGELQEAIHRTQLLPSYDIVTLLIGVNNQYRGLPVGDYVREFEALLGKALQLTGGRTDRVFVLSIPDWGYTPFATNRPEGQPAITRQINAFNEAARSLVLPRFISWLDITPGTRQALTDDTRLAADQLHYSAREYGRWAVLLADAIGKALTR